MAALTEVAPTPPEPPTNWDYHSIKQFAKRMRAAGLPCRVDDLIVLARQNDPFYVGAPADIVKGEWFAECWRRAGFKTEAHLRRAHYRIGSLGILKPDGSPYSNTDRDWAWLLVASLKARYLGLVDIEEMADRRTPSPYLYATVQYGPNADFSIDLPELTDPFVSVDYSLASVQPYLLEVWCEKSTMDDVLDPICRRFHANLCTNRGEASHLAIAGLFSRIRAVGKPARIFYISDYDKKGWEMPQSSGRKLEYFVRELAADMDVKLCRLALNMAQITEYDLPPLPAGDKRGEEKWARTRGGACELDALEALHPGSLTKILEDALAHYHSDAAEQEARDKQRQLQEAVREQLNAISARYEREIEALASMIEEMEAIEIENLDEYEPDRASPDADDDPFDWLLDTERDYSEQLDAFKQYMEP